MTLSNGYFGGSGSFMTNGYAIWQKGLAGDDGKRYPNPYAVWQGNTHVQRMLYARSLDSRSSFYEFISYLERLQKKEADKERRFIEYSLSSSPLVKIDSKQYQAIQTAVNNDNFGMAYTLLLKTEEEYSKLVEEFRNGKFKNISHTNEFWHSQFIEYFGKRLEQSLEISGEQLVKKLGQGSLTVDQIIEDFVTEKLQGSDGVVVDSFKDIKRVMKDDLARELHKYGIIKSESILEDVFQSTDEFTKLSGKTKTVTPTTKQKRSLERVVKNISEHLVKAVGLGLSTEIQTAAKQGRISDLTISTGDMMKNFTKALSGTEQEVKQKADTVSFVLWQGDLNIKELSEKYFGKGIAPTQKNFEAFIQDLQQTAGLENKIFMVSTNVKGYRSKFDLQIAQKATYTQRAADLSKMAKEAEGMPELSIKKLIFLFNNTMRGCIAASETDKIAEYVAAVCTAWMWDEYSEIFSVQESTGAIEQIRMFNSGGTYYSVSQLIQRGIDQLRKSIEGNFVAVTFYTPSFDAQGFYNELRGKYPVPRRDSSYQEWQGQLKKRWDEMRDQVSASGKISISIRQKELESILGDLSQYL